MIKYVLLLKILTLIIQEKNNKIYRRRNVQYNNNLLKYSVHLTPSILFFNRTCSKAINNFKALLLGVNKKYVLACITFFSQTDFFKVNLIRGNRKIQLNILQKPGIDRVSIMVYFITLLSSFRLLGTEKMFNNFVPNNISTLNLKGWLYN